MENNVGLLLSYLSNGKNIRYSHIELEKVFGDFFKTLENLKFLQKSQPLKEILCPICDTPHCVTVTEDDSRFYASCELTGIMEKIDEQSLVSYKFAPSAVARWLASELKLTDSIEQLEDIVWHLGLTTGGKPNFKVYFICTEDFEIAISKYNPDSMLYLWLGEIPHNKTVGKNIVSLKELLSLSGNKLELNKQPFNTLTGLLTKEVEEITLRSDSAIRKEDEKHYLLLGRNESLHIFNHIEGISPRAYNLLKFANHPKKFKNGFTLGEVVDAEIVQNKRSVSPIITELNSRYTNNGLAQIFVKTDRTHWKLDSPSMVNGEI